jgi:plastocyanin
MRLTFFVGLLVALASVPWAGARGDEPFVVELTARDGRFFPDELRVPAGRRIKIVIRNQGSEPIEFESLELRKEKVLAPGAQSFVVIAPLKPGQYQFFDEFHPDTGRGRLVVQP